MIDQLWQRWKEMRDRDPVKARLVRVLLIVGTVVMPFLTAWVWKGFAYAMGMVAGLVISGLGLLVALALINKFCGWIAHYVLTGVVPDFDDWMDNTILDEWESYQYKKSHPSKPKPVSVQTPHEPQAPRVQATNLNPMDDGPEWLRKQ